MYIYTSVHIFVYVIHMYKNSVVPPFTAITVLFLATNIHICIYPYIYLCVCVYIYTFIHIRVYVYICTRVSRPSLTAITVLFLASEKGDPIFPLPVLH